MAPPTLTPKAAVAPHPGDPAPASQEEHLDVECPICYHEYNLYNKCPRMLECLHVFCTECLHKIQLCPIVPGDPHSPTALPCPLCRHLTSLESSSAHSLPSNSRILARLPPMPAMPRRLPGLPMTTSLSTVTQRVVLALEGEDSDARYIILPTVSLRVPQIHPYTLYETAPGLMGEVEVMQQTRRTLFCVPVLALIFLVVFVIICVFGGIFGPNFFNRKL